MHRHLYHSGKDLYHSVKVVWVQGRMRFDVGWVQGSYFADDAGKIDQYVVEDQRYNAASPLHQVLTVSSLQPPRLLSHIRFCSAADAGRRTVSISHSVTGSSCCAAVIQRQQQQASRQCLLCVCFQVLANARAKFLVHAY